MLGLVYGAVSSNPDLVDDMGGFIDDHFGVNAGAIPVSTPATPPGGPDDDDHDFGTSQRGDSRKLRSNMERSGVSFRAGEDAHHMVASNVSHFARSRDLLSKFRIDINSAENGVALTGARSGATQDMFALSHRGSGLHSRAMAKYLENGLGRARTRDQAVQFLRDTAMKIKDGSIKGVAGL